MGSLENHHGVGLILKTCRKNAMLNVRVHGAHGNSPEDRAVWTLDSILQKKCKKEMFVMAKVQSRDFPDVTHDAPCMHRWVTSMLKASMGTERPDNLWNRYLRPLTTSLESNRYVIREGIVSRPSALYMRKVSSRA